MHDPFLAIDAATDLRAHARRLRRVWEAALGGEPDRLRARPVIEQSWTRLALAGLRPTDLRPRRAVERADLDELRRESGVAPALPALRHCLGQFALDAQHLMVVCDAAGRVLWVEGHPGVRRRAERITFLEGMLWSEDSAGTNAIGTALTIGRPVQIFSAEHFLPDQHAWWCSAAPIRDPGTGRVLGVVDLSGPLRTAHPHSLALVSAAARMGEQLLPSDPRPVAVPGRRARHGKGAAPAGRRPDDRRREPAARAALRVLGRQRLTLELDGAEPLELTRRQAEILAVLAMHPAGLTAEQLTLHVYGERGNCISARAAMSRLRKLLGRRLAAVPYRLVGDVSADFLEVEAALAAGDLDAALRAYRGPLLPDSEAPRVAQARDELEGALRRAAVAGTCAQLRVWLETESGRSDPQAMACFLRRAPRADPGRPLIAARLQSLCARWGLPAPAELAPPAAPALRPS